TRRWHRRPLEAEMRGWATVLRGGSWNNNPINLRTTNRNNNTPDNRNNNIGFRCASESPNLGAMPSLHGGRHDRGKPHARSRLATAASRRDLPRRPVSKPEPNAGRRN